jgi:hypothetical protein
MNEDDQEREHVAEQQTDDERDRLRRRLLAVGEASHQLEVELEGLTSVRRHGVADGWLADLADLADGHDPATPGAAESTPALRLVRAESGSVYLIEGDRRRLVASGLLTTLLEQELGERQPVTHPELERLAEAPPVEVLESSEGPPFIVVAGVRRPLRGLPLPHPVRDDEADRFAEGGELDVGHLNRKPKPAAPTDAEADDGELPPLPTFLIIGAQKSATRWLRANLGQHPDIYAAPSELEFFNNDTHFQHQGPAWYRRQFGGWAGEAFIGEATPGYMMWWHQPEVVARRIRKVVPDARLMAILRNPVDRAYSAMVHHQKRERIAPDAKLLDLVRATPPESDYFGLIAGGWYAASLRPFARAFGDHLLVLLHDDIDTDANGVYAKALSHVGADPQFVPRNLRKVRFSNQSDRDETDDPLSHEERVELYEYFRRDVDELSELLDRDLSSWDPANRSTSTTAASGGVAGPADATS